jgi:hypothetical protein
VEAIADYVLVRLLGRGSAGRTFLADPPERLGLGEPCVVKVLDRRVTEEELRRVVDELRAVASLRAVPVVQLFEAGQDGGQLFTAMRHHGEPPLAPADPRGMVAVLRIVADAATGVHALHEIGVVHRQVSPSNVLTSGGRGVVCEPSLAPLVAPGLTSTGSGNFAALAFLEPDVIWGEPASRATDIWALGVTLQQALTGASVYPDLPDDSVAAAFRHVLHTGPTIDEALPPAVGELVARCLAPRRADRFGSALDLANAVERALRGLEGGERGLEAPALPTEAMVVSLRTRPGEGPTERPRLPIEGSTAVPAVDSADVVVQGRRCARGHLNNPAALTCARCGIKLVSTATGLVEGIRPPLGVLTLDDGSSFPLTGDVVLGREPGGDELVLDGRAQAVRIADEGRTVSRSHALVRLVDWDVTIEDRGSANGTFVRTAPHQPWQRLTGHERVTLVAGAGIRLGERELGFEQHSVL